MMPRMHGIDSLQSRGAPSAARILVHTAISSIGSSRPGETGKLRTSDCVGSILEVVDRLVPYTTPPDLESFLEGYTSMVSWTSALISGCLESVSSQVPSDDLSTVVRFG